MQAKEEGTFRIWGNNFNGLTIDDSGGDFMELCDEAATMQADIVLGTEHNLDARKYYVRKKCYETCRQHSTVGHYKLQMSSTVIKAATLYKPGGTLLLARGNCVARILDGGDDAMGRWSYIRMAARGNRVVSIIMAYQPCAVRGNPKGKFTVHAQQSSLLRQANMSDPKPNPRKYFRHDLTILLKRLKAQGDDLIVMGDFNEALGNDPAGMSKICRELVLSDIMKLRHGTSDKPATYARGHKRLDYLLMSERCTIAVRNCGYKPFNHRLFSDHRGMFVDLDMELLFGNLDNVLAAMTYRDFRASNPQAVSKYLQGIQTYLTEHNFFTRMKRLSATSGHDHGLAEALDKDLTCACISASKRCRKMRLTPWSPKVIKAWDTVNILKRLLGMFRTHLNMSKSIAKLRSKASQRRTLPITAMACSIALREVQGALKTIVRAAAAHRRDHLENLAEICALREDKDKSKNLKQLIQAEDIKAMYSKIRALRKNQSRQGITKLDVLLNPNDEPKTCRQWRTVDLPNKILALLRNQEHFGQAEGTPFTAGTLKQDFNFEGLTQTSEMVLEGTYTNAESDKITFAFARKHTTLNARSWCLTEAEFLGKIRNWKELTSTSPSGVNLSHYHALWRPFDKDPQSPEGKNLAHIQAYIITTRVALINYSLGTGYVYDRWKDMVNVMILKEPNNHQIHGLRVIHLYEADYNLILGVKWRDALHHAEDNHLLNSSNYGSQPGRQAHDPVLIEELELEICRASRKGLVKLDIDATSCYDRILPILASIISRSYGVHKNVALVIARTLKAARYKLKTMLGVTDEWYSHTNESPIYGTGQGSGNSPTIWCFVNFVLFDTFKSKANGALFESPDRQLSLRLYMIGFVDDSSGQVNAFDEHPQPTPDEFIRRMKQDGQLWNDILWSSGGDLNLGKCSYHHIHYSFSDDGEPFLSGKNGPPLVLTSADRFQPRVIQHKSSYDHHKTLGVYKSPSGKHSKQLQILKKKSDEHGNTVKTSPFTWHEAWTFYYSIWLTSVGYPLPSCSFTFAQLDGVQRRAIRAILSRCGYNRHTHRAIIFGPLSLGGANFCHLWVEQGNAQVMTFLQTLATPQIPDRTSITHRSGMVPSRDRDKRFFSGRYRHPASPF
jgi:hypothetical protein